MDRHPQEWGAKGASVRGAGGVPGVELSPRACESAHTRSHAEKSSLGRCEHTGSSDAQCGKLWLQVLSTLDGR